jgi:AcrR family transcriptional regulator
VRWVAWPRAGINERMIYHHFGSEDRLYTAVLEAQAHGPVQAWRQIIDTAAELEPYEGMRRVLAGFADLFAARPLLVVLTLHEALGGWRTLPLPTADTAPFPSCGSCMSAASVREYSAPTARLRSPTGSP